MIGLCDTQSRIPRIQRTGARGLFQSNFIYFLYCTRKGISSTESRLPPGGGPKAPPLRATSRTKRSRDKFPDDFGRRGDKSAPLSEIRKLNRASPPLFSAESISNFLHIPSSFALTPARYWFTALAETEGLKEVTLVTLI